jgi:hypothetical protein
MSTRSVSNSPLACALAHTVRARQAGRGRALREASVPRSEPQPVALADAFARPAPIAVEDNARYSRAPARWHGRAVGFYGG